MPLNLFLHKKQKASQRTPFGSSTPFDGRIGFFAAVTEVHPENNTVHVVTDSGRELTNVPVASGQWVTYVKDGKPQLTGERNLPPAGTYVFCIMPNGTYEDSFVLCSMFSTAAIHADYMEDSEDAANIRLTQESGGWIKTTDIRTGTKKIQNRPKDPSITVEIDEEDAGKESAKLTIHGTEISITKEGIEIKSDGKVTKSFEGDIKIDSDGNVELASTKTGILKIGNSVDTLGKTIDSLLQYLMSLKTVGSPAAQSASPDFVAQIQALKTKWGQIFS